MARTYEGLVTAALVIAAVAAIGCSERGKAPDKKVQESKAVPTTFVADDKGTAEPLIPVIPGPVSFADGETAYQARNYTGAAQLFARYAEQSPGNAWGQFMLGLSAWKGGDLARAEVAFDEALRLDPDHVKSLVNSSRVLLDLNRPDDAVSRLMRAAELDATSSDVHRLLGRAYHAQGNTDGAVAAYRQAIEIDGQDSWSMNNLGLLFIEEGRPAEALPLLARAVELRKDVPAFQNNLGMALEHTGRFSAAAAAYGGALAADAAYDKARKNLARVEQVKQGPEEPFDLEATAKRFVEESEAARVETTVSQ